MGKLVSFEKRRRLMPVKLTDADRGQVLIFTGVRYQRGLDPASNVPPPVGPKRKNG